MDMANVVTQQRVESMKAVVTGDIAKELALRTYLREPIAEIFGTIDLWKDKADLKSAGELKRLLDHVVAELEKTDLPEKVEFAATDKVPCPF